VNYSIYQCNDCNQYIFNNNKNNFSSSALHILNILRQCICKSNEGFSFSIDAELMQHSVTVSVLCVYPFRSIFHCMEFCQLGSMGIWFNTGTAMGHCTSAWNSVGYTYVQCSAYEIYTVGFFMTTCEATWYIVSVVSVSVSLAITFERCNIGGSYLHIQYISREYGSSLYMKVIGSRSRSLEQNCRTPYSRKVNFHQK